MTDHEHDCDHDCGHDHSHEHTDTDETMAKVINDITGKVSDVLLNEFLSLPEDMQIGLVLTKSSQLLMANVLCQVAQTKEELQQLIGEHLLEIQMLTLKCAEMGYAQKFDASHSH